MQKNKKIILLFFIFILFSKPTFSASNNAIYYYNLGIDYYNNKKDNLAIQSYKKALALNPNFTEAYYNLAIAYYHINQPALAIANFQKVIKLNPNYSNAKKYLEKIYFNLAFDYQEKQNYPLALQNYRKVIQLNPNNISAYENMALIYKQTGDNFSLIETYKKIISLSPNNAQAYFALGYYYSNIEQYELAVTNYQKALEIKPDFEEAKHNLEVSSKIINGKILANRINLSRPTQKAPSEVYNLVRFQSGVNHISFDEIAEILDFMWSDRDGRILLSVIKDNKIPINITPGESNTNANIETKEYKQTLSLYGIIPIFTFDVSKKKTIEINIGEDHIRAFRDTNLPASARIYAFQVIPHEFGHAVKNTLSKQNDNAMQEEIATSMIGYNIASRIFNGRDLTEQEAFEYSKRCLKGVLIDNHRLLPLYDNFINEMQKIGIYPPYPYLYQSIPELYKSIKNDPDTVRLDSLEMTTNYH